MSDQAVDYVIHIQVAMLGEAYSSCYQIQMTKCSDLSKFPYTQPSISRANVAVHSFRRLQAYGALEKSATVLRPRLCDENTGSSAASEGNSGSVGKTVELS
jgi:hypothetical protein